MKFILEICETSKDEQNRLMFEEFEKKIEENKLSLHVKDLEIRELKSAIACNSRELDELKSLHESKYEGTIRVEIENMEENMKENVYFYPKVDKYIILNGFKW